MKNKYKEIIYAIPMAAFWATVTYAVLIFLFIASGFLLLHSFFDVMLEIMNIGLDLMGVDRTDDFKILKAPIFWSVLVFLSFLLKSIFKKKR